jgi:energy-converting hydrogenase Eha subunit C
MKRLIKNKNKLRKIIVLSLLMCSVFTTIVFADPIDNFADYANQRIATIFLVIVAFYVTKNIAKNATNKLIGFILIAILGGILVYKPEFIEKGADWVYNILF